MLTNYYTLRALVREWEGRLKGAVLSVAYSQTRGECTLVFESERDSNGPFWSLKISLQAPLRYLFMNPGMNRAKKNVADLFETCRGANVDTISIAEGDRLIDIRLSGGRCPGGRCLRIVPFGPRANIYLVGSDGLIEDRFRNQGVAKGDSPPRAHDLPKPGTASEMVLKWGEDPISLDRRVLRCFPGLGRVLAAEACQRAGLDASSERRLSGEELDRLFLSVKEIVEDLDHPRPRIFWKEERAEMLSLIPLSRVPDAREEIFESVDEAVRVYARRLHRQAAFDRRFDPIERVLRSRLEKAKRSRENMQEELRKASRADRYEHWAHLLMAGQHLMTPGSEVADLDDIITGTGGVSIPLVPGLSAVQNAERYYEKARETRRSRASSKERLVRLESSIASLLELKNELSELSTPSEVDRFRKNHQGPLAELSAQGTGIDLEIPFRRYTLHGGYEVWVGRNARQNDRLTLQFARKHDLWLHARGVSGSHTVLRLPARKHRPPAAVIERAAAIAAYHSKARTSSLAPVIVTERKYVRKPRKSRPGTVIVEREKVLIVKPGLPEGGSA